MHQGEVAINPVCQASVHHENDGPRAIVGIRSFRKHEKDIFGCIARLHVFQKLRTGPDDLRTPGMIAVFK